MNEQKPDDNPFLTSILLFLLRSGCLTMFVMSFVAVLAVLWRVIRWAVGP